MLLKIEWLEKKTATINGSPKQLLEGTFVGEDGVKYEKATIWREDKEGGVFPNFDDLKPGHSIQGNPWKHPTKGSITIYPEKPTNNASNGNFKATGGINKAMEKKAENIEHAQDRKEESISKASCQRDAVLLTTTFYKDMPMSDKDIADKIEYWRNYLSAKLDSPF